MTQSLDAALRAFQPALPLGVAFSGGADSTALLMACAAQWPGQVVALHVNHGLQAAAADFEAHCVALCAQLNVPLRVQKVDAGHAPGQSPEDAARIARYKAFGALARIESAQEAIKSIALAQHADDQVETLLLALSRGAGLRGLSAMPAQWTRDGLDFHRPLLQVSAADILAWLAARSAGFVEDPTNTDHRFTRNRIRAQLLPALEAVFPQFRDTLARSAAHAASAERGSVSGAAFDGEDHAWSAAYTAAAHGVAYAAAVADKSLDVADHARVGVIFCEAFLTSEWLLKPLLQPQLLFQIRLIRLGCWYVQLW